MTSGIYKLTFKSGDTYIGKSINVDNRWDQHADKMRKGTAAKSVQNAYNTYGMPNGIILAECHQDHLDLLEACYIAGHNPSLNTSRPTNQLAEYTEDTIQAIIKYCAQSTIDHIRLINDQSISIDTLNIKNIRLESEIIKLKKIRSEREINKEHNKQVKELTEEVTSYKEILNHQSSIIKELKDYKNSSWWNKLFN